MVGCVSFPQGMYKIHSHINTEESESEVHKTEESESEHLSTDSTALVLPIESPVLSPKTTYVVFYLNSMTKLSLNK